MAGNKRELAGRASEQRILKRLVTSEKSEFLAIYGRRRVGKTFLIRRFFESQPAVYFEMVGRYGGSMAQQLRIFSDALSRAFHHGAELLPPANWKEAFRALEQELLRVTAQSKTPKKCVLFFDELPWIATHKSGCLEELEHFWNAWATRQDNIILVACGSAASWMLRRIVRAKGGLHNRLTQTLRLLPFTLPEVQEFFELRKLQFSPKDIIELYMILGGVPHYLDHVRRGMSVAQVVDQLCFDKDGPLKEEFDRLFVSLFGDDARYVQVVQALASKRRGLSRKELISALNLDSGGGVTQILENLEEGGFISATIPFGRTSRDRFFRLTDEFSLFHLQWLAKRRPSSWQHVRGSATWNAWAGLAFESVCLKHACFVQNALGIRGVHTEVSGWLHESAQIDMVIDRADGVISLVEIKFSNAAFTITKKYAEELRTKVAVFKKHTGTKKAVHLVLLTTYGLTHNSHSQELVDAELTMEALFQPA